MSRPSMSVPSGKAGSVNGASSGGPTIIHGDSSYSRGASAPTTITASRTARPAAAPRLAQNLFKKAFMDQLPWMRGR